MSGRDEVSAEELMARLNADPDWVARRERQESSRRKGVEANRRAAAPVVVDLRSAGFQVDSIADLHNRGLKYGEAIPVLLSWLPRVENPAVKEDIVRSLTVGWARPQAAPVLVEEFRRTGEDGEDVGLRWAVGNALAEVAGDEVYEDVADLASDPRWGRSREMVTVALGNMSDPRAVQLLRELLRDEQVAGFAVWRLTGSERARRDRTSSRCSIIRWPGCARPPDRRCRSWRTESAPKRRTGARA